jgi:predicted kinase
LILAFVGKQLMAADAKTDSSIYANERSRLDYKYFPAYDSKRQSVHDSIVTAHLKGGETSNAPWLIYGCGAYGVGKSHSLKTLKYIQKGMIMIDPDAIKSLLPSDTTDLHLEATFVASIIEQACISRGWSAVIDGSLHNAVWYSDYFTHIKKSHPEYRLCIIKVDCDLPTILKRCEARAKITKRIIPESVIRTIHDKVPHSFQMLRTMVDCIVQIENYDRLQVTSI